MLEIDTIGTYNTFKATIPELLKTKGAFQAISATLHYKGHPREFASPPTSEDEDADDRVLITRARNAQCRRMFQPPRPA